MDISIATISSKGQIVLPKEIRKNLANGDKVVFIKTKNGIIMKPMTELDKHFEEDIEFARRTHEAWKRYERGEFKSMDENEFLEELEKW